jgi:hypothetical protein
LSCGKADKTAAAASGKGATAGNRGPSAAILGRWSLPAAPTTYAFADLGALLKTEVLQKIQSSVMLLTQGSLTKEGNACALQFVAAVREAAVAGTEQEQIAIILYDKTALKTPFSVCAKAFGGLPPIKIQNTKEAYEVNGAVLAILPDTVVVGTRALVEASLSKAPKSAWPKDLFLTNDRQVAFHANNHQEQLDLRGYLSVTKSHFAAHTDVTFPTEAAAKSVAESVAPAKLKQDFLDQSPMGDDRVKDKLLQHWHVKQTQRSVAFEFSMDGSPDSMAQQLGLVSAISIFGVRKYIANAKAEEARHNVRVIAEHVIAAHPKKLVSLPPVPGRFEVLQGKKYQSVAEDWSEWKPIDFSLSAPQYYQYRLEAAKDGKSVLVIAEGDLDANGQRSLFSLQIRRDPKSREITASPTIDERDPLE